MIMKDMIIKLFESWKCPGKLDTSLFTKDFTYDCGSNVHTTDVWMNADNGDSEIIDAEILKIETSDSEGEISFKFKDPVTLLELTITWKVMLAGNLIKQVIET